MNRRLTEAEYTAFEQGRMQQTTRLPTGLNSPSRVLRTTDKAEPRLSANEQLIRMMHARPKQSKYRNKKTEVDGIVFDSKKEAARYVELKALERESRIKALTLQVRMPLEIDGIRICAYVCDFRYLSPVAGGWKTTYEDVKGKRTPVYLLKKKLVRAILGVEILET